MKQIEDSLPFRSGDVVFFKGDTFEVESVRQCPDREGSVIVETCCGRAFRYPKSNWREYLVARDEDMYQLSVLDLRTKEVTLMSQLQIMRTHTRADAEWLDCMAEIERTLFAIRRKLKHRGARVAG